MQRASGFLSCGNKFWLERSMAITSLRGSCKCLYSDACMSPFHEAALVCLPIVADLTDLPLSCLPSRLLGGLRLRGKTRRNTSPPAAAEKGAVDVESRNIARLPKATLDDTSYQLALVIGGDGSQAGRRGRHREARPLSHIATHTNYREWAGTVERTQEAPWA